MICKWCGASMDRLDTVCRRCGKEMNAKSDCGGFYDLVPNARNMAMPAPQPVVQQPVVQSAPEPAKKSGLTAILALLCCVLAVVAVVAMISGNGAKEEISRLERKLESLEDVQPLEDIKPTLAQMDALVSLKLEHTDGLVSMKVDADPAGAVTVSCDPAMLTGNITGYTAQLDLPNGGTTARAVIGCDLGVQDAALVVTCRLAEGFGESEAGFSLGKLWYVNSEGKNTELVIPGGTELLTVAEAEDGAVTLTLSREVLGNILEANELPGETVAGCDLVRENAEKGSLTIQVEGISAAE